MPEIEGPGQFAGALSGGRVPPGGSSGLSTSHRRGPHCGQATGWAWKRRSRGSRYSASQRGQKGKQAMLVVARS